jgi:hypothetical protein
LVVLEATTPVARHARVGFSQHGNQVFEFVRRHRRAYADFVDLRHRHPKRHVANHGSENEVLLQFSGVEWIFLADGLDLAGSMLGIDDGVALFELHSDLAQNCRNGLETPSEQTLKCRGKMVVFIGKCPF